MSEQTSNYEQSQTPSLLRDGDEAYLQERSAHLLPYDEGVAIARAAAKLAAESRPRPTGEQLSPQEQRVRQNGRAVIEMRDLTLAA